MKLNPKHERRWASDTVPNKTAVSSAGTSPGSGYNSVEEFVEVTLDLQDDNTIVLRSVEPATPTPTTVINIEGGVSGSGGQDQSPVVSASAPASRSTSIGRSSSSKLRQFSQELKLFSQELKAELKRFSWSHGHGTSKTPLAASDVSAVAAAVASGGPGGGGESGFASAMAARALRRERAQLDRTRSGAHKALRGLRFISTKTNTNTNGVDGWNQVQTKFNDLAKDGFLYRADFAQCIGIQSKTHSVTVFCNNFFYLYIFLLFIFIFLKRNEGFEGVCFGAIRCFGTKKKIKSRQN